MQTKFTQTILLSLALGLGTPAFAAKPGRADIPRDPAADPLMLAAGFLNHHPDLRFRLEGQKAYASGARAKARDLFERAAMYGDKPSQGLIAEMLWSGDGIPMDRASAYAWMDLAAERAYRPLLVLRERYWEALDTEERTLAVQRGVALYARYGDAVAKPRLASILRRGRMHTTGSRTGFTGNLTVIVPWGGGEMSIPGSQFYDARYWQPDQYWAWQDAVWTNPRTGVVNVGSVENASEKPEPPPKKAADESGKDD